MTCVTIAIAARSVEGSVANREARDELRFAYRAHDQLSGSRRTHVIVISHIASYFQDQTDDSVRAKHTSTCGSSSLVRRRPAWLNGSIPGERLERLSRITVRIGLREIDHADERRAMYPSCHPRRGALGGVEGSAEPFKVYPCIKAKPRRARYRQSRRVIAGRASLWLAASS
jgi:hypothetical protein